MKVLIVIKNIDGGTGTFMFQLLKLPQVDPTIESCRVVSLEKPIYSDISALRYVTSVHYKHEDYGYRNIHKVIHLLIKEAIFLYKEMKKDSPDVIVPIDLHCSLMVCFLKLISFSKAKVIITIHNNISAVFALKHTFFPPLLIKAFGRFILQNARAAVGVSRGVSKEFKKVFHFTKPMRTIYYGLDLKETTRLSHQVISPVDQRAFKKKIFTIISVGRLAPQKDVQTLLKSCRLLLDAKITFRLVLVGAGKDIQMINEIIRRDNLQKNVFLLGWKPNIYPYLARSDVFILSTRYEGFPYVILEAMSQRLPIISSDVDFGPREVLDGGKYGILVPAQDSISLFLSLKKVATNSRLRRELAKKSFERIKFFSEDKMLRTYDSLIKSL